MTANSVPGDAGERLARVESLLDDVVRIKSRPLPKVRDLYDTDVQQVTDGQVAVYRKATGKWHPLHLLPPFDLYGPVVVSISDPWPVLADTRVRRMYARLKTTGTTGTTVRLLKNGSAVSGATVTIAPAALAGAAGFDVTFDGPELDYMQAEVTAAGAGAHGLVVQFT